ncbi:ABC transporter ATP-binding protein [Pseudoflavonifractor capillosus]|uniref:ABC transporter ATP-binding protein n=1 Tax=Pseudoflavonifractor capillosus TaxID=106588 RepID=UPI00195DFAEF|nr:ABC transporter ATP-binding protein [Pseudoflavonifractor capillosus]MBM6693914.1 ABC transporter ATP-binding protein [Pseudoflavonifractor capillosus]
MLKLKRYLKPYAVLLLMGIVFLFGQAMLELSLPNYMSDIVNVGLQQGGITSPAPQVISADAFGLMEQFMSQEDRDVVEGAYVALADHPDYEDLSATFPKAADTDLALNTQDTQAVETAFGRASYALTQVMSQASGSNEDDQASMAEGFQALGQMLAQPQAQALIQQAIDVAAQTPDTMLEQTGVAMVKAFYQQLGADTDAIQTHYILTTGGRMAVLAVLLTLCAVAAGYCMARMGAGVARDLRRDVFTKVTYFNNDEMDRFSGATLITRSTNDITQVQNFLSMGLRLLCFAPIMGIGGLIMGLSTCVNLAWVLALALIVMLGLLLVLFAVAMPRFKKMQALVDRLNLVSREEIGGLMVVRAFSNQKFMQDRFEKANGDLTSNTLFVNRAMATMMPAMTLVMNGLSLLIVWFGGKQIAASNLQVGDMMAFIQYAMHVIMSFLFISMMFIMVPRASVSAERINEILQTEVQVKDSDHPTHLSQPVKGVVEFRDVSFRYPGADADVLEHVSFVARPGQTTAFIGSTGSGKSTLINLIPRFHDVSEGSITLDGVDIRDIPQKELRDAIGYVPQKGLLLRGTVESNLRYGNPDASQDTIDNSARIAQASEFISHLDQGMQTPISQGGTNVSGGQRQRLSIARALAKEAPVYIFDDTFSALDFKTDAQLRAALKEYTTQATVLIVAQRVSTILDADQILVLDQGKVVGCGTHQELMRTCKTYQEIAQSQLSKEELA